MFFFLYKFYLFSTSQSSIFEILLTFILLPKKTVNRKKNEKILQNNGFRENQFFFY